MHRVVSLLHKVQSQAETSGAAAEAISGTSGRGGGAADGGGADGGAACSLSVTSLSVPSTASFNVAPPMSCAYTMATGTEAGDAAAGTSGSGRQRSLQPEGVPELRGGRGGALPGGEAQAWGAITAPLAGRCIQMLAATPTGFTATFAKPNSSGGIE